LVVGRVESLLSFSPTTFIAGRLDNSSSVPSVTVLPALSE
jgi:hypothetical protein